MACEPRGSQGNSCALCPHLDSDGAVGCFKLHAHSGVCCTDHAPFVAPAHFTSLQLWYLIKSRHGWRCILHLGHGACIGWLHKHFQNSKGIMSMQAKRRPCCALHWLKAQAFTGLHRHYEHARQEAPWLCTGRLSSELLHVQIACCAAAHCCMQPASGLWLSTQTGSG